MIDYIPSDFTKTVPDVAEYLDRNRTVGFWKTFTSQQIIRRGEAYMDVSRRLIEQYHLVMDPGDKESSRAAYNEARDARDKLETSGVSGFQKLRKAREFKGLSKEGYLVTKRASNRGLDNSVVGQKGPGGTNPSVPPGAPPTALEDSDGTDPPASSPEEPDGTVPPAGVPPANPEEPDTRPPPHDLSTDSHATLSPGAADIGGPMDEVSETYSFVYDPDFASSETSIASYKTERTVNSRKSRYNVLPRRKHADSGHLGVTEGIASLNVDDAPVQGAEVPTAGLPPGPSWMMDRAQEVDNLSHNLSNGLCSVSEVLFGADDCLDD